MTDEDKIFDYTVLPKWDIHLIDEDGNPEKTYSEVIQFWRNHLQRLSDMSLCGQLWPDQDDQERDVKAYVVIAIYVQALEDLHRKYHEMAAFMTRLREHHQPRAGG